MLYTSTIQIKITLWSYMFCWLGIDQVINYFSHFYDCGNSSLKQHSFFTPRLISTIIAIITTTNFITLIVLLPCCRWPSFRILFSRVLMISHRCHKIFITNNVYLITSVCLTCSLPKRFKITTTVRWKWITCSCYYGSVDDCRRYCFKPPLDICFKYLF